MWAGGGAGVDDSLQLLEEASGETGLEFLGLVELVGLEMLGRLRVGCRFEAMGRGADTSRTSAFCPLLPWRRMTPSEPGPSQPPFPALGAGTLDLTCNLKMLTVGLMPR
jgi:hypothetical protein